MAEVKPTWALPLNHTRPKPNLTLFGEKSPLHSLTAGQNVKSPVCNCYHCECMAQTIEISIRLLDEGTECSRPTQALELGNGLFKVLPTSNYDPADEVWEFPPDSIVRSEVRCSEGKEFLLAVSL